MVGLVTLPLPSVIVPSKSFGLTFTGTMSIKDEWKKVKKKSSPVSRNILKGLPATGALSG